MNYGTLIHSLHDLTDETETIYINFADSYHSLMNEAENCIKTSSEMIGELQTTAQLRKNSIEESANHILASVSADLQEKELQFVSMHSSDNHFFQRIDECIECTHNLIDEINIIKDYSIDMWLLALNAMTAGIKAGKAGGALPVITNEFKKKSELSLEDMQEILDLGIYINEKLSTFKSLAEKLKIDQKKLIQKLGTMFNENMDLFKKELRINLTIVNSLVKRSKTIKEPLFSIMEEIQKQDILRQSIEQIEILVNEVKDKSYSEEKRLTEQLDYLSFRKKMTDLCRSLIDDIEKQITGTRLLFKENSEEVRLIIVEVEKEQKWFASGNRGNPAVVADSFLGFQGLVDDIELSRRNKLGICKTINELMNLVKKIDEKFTHFASIVRIYQNINIFYRIEVEKQPALHHMRDNVFEIVSIADKMQLSIEKMQITTGNFNSLMEQVGIEYAQKYEQEERFLNNLNQSVQIGEEQLTILWKSLEKSASGFSIFTGSFYSMFDESTKNIDYLQKLIDKILGIKSHFREAYNEAEAELSSLIESNELSEWIVTDENMKEMIERFTIYQHKKKAGELAGLEIEDGSEAGVLTLF